MVRPCSARKRLEAQSHTIEHFHMEDIHSFYWWDSKIEARLRLLGLWSPLRSCSAVPLAGRPGSSCDHRLRGLTPVLPL